MTLISWIFVDPPSIDRQRYRMDDQGTNQQAESKHSQTGLERSLILVTLAAWLLADLSQRANLVDHIPLAITAIGALTGAAFGAWVSLRIYRKLTREPSGRVAQAIILYPLVTLLIGTYAARFVVETVAFAGITPSAVEQEARVINLDTNWKDKAGVSLGDGTREIDIRIDRELYSNLQPWRWPGRDCLSVRVETGRGGLRRIVTPNYFEKAWGVKHYVLCGWNSIDPTSAFQPMPTVG